MPIDKDKVILTRVTSEMHKQLRMKAAEKDVTIQTLVRELIEEFLKNK